MTGERMYPILPCPDVDQAIDFYRALGFETTYRQTRPNPHAVVEREDMGIHLAGIDGFDPEQSYASVIIVVPDPDALYASFAAGLRAALGRVPASGIPRILRPRKKWGTVYGFSVVDVGGNWLRISGLGAQEAATDDAEPGLERAITVAARLAESKGDDAAAFKTLESAIARAGDAPPIDRARALLYRAELAIRLGRSEDAASSLEQVTSLELTDDERAGIADDVDHVTQPAGRRAVASASMCEHFIARAAEPFRLDELWPFAERLERFGIAGFGWGAAWLAGDGRLASHRDILAFRDDHDGRENVGRVETTAALVHLRRPSRLSTLTMADTQPFDDPAGRYSLSHNGDLRDYRQLRTRYREQGRIRGRADTEVGARWLEDAWHDGEPPAHLLGALHDRFGGQANLAVLTADGTPHHYAGNSENPVFSFRLGRVGIVSTGIYSLDRSIFRFVAPRATERRMVHLHTTVGLGRNGEPIQAS